MEAMNVYPNANGTISQISYKTLRSLITELRKINKNCTKFNFKTEIRITLPVRS